MRISAVQGKSMLKLLSRYCFSMMLVVLMPEAGNAAEKTSTDSLKILVYGASGKVGTHIVDEALNRGHVVTAVSRDPSRISQVHDNLSAVQGDILDTDSIRSLAAGQDVIIISVRGVVGKTKDPASAVPRLGVENVVEVLRDFEDPKPRLIHVGGAGALEVEPGVLYADKLPKILLPRKLQVEIAGQVLALEYLKTVNDVCWSYASPPKNFTNGKRTGVFRIGGNQLLENSRGRSRVSRADFAVALIDEAENDDHAMQQFSIVY
jgi:putative NADH-flavin reductase